VKLYVAVDIEAFGHADNVTPFSVGFCYGTSWDDRKKFRVTMIPTGPHTYYSSELSGKSNEEYGKMICDSLNNPEEFSKVMQIFCDPAYDFSHLNRAVSTYCDELPVRYSNRYAIYGKNWKDSSNRWISLY
jgi:hypothetical protein